MSKLRVPAWRATLPQAGDRVVAAFRAALGVGLLTHTEAAELAGVSQSTVTRWANGQLEPSLEQMQRVSSAVHRRAEAVAEKTRGIEEVMTLTGVLARHAAAGPSGKDPRAWAQELGDLHEQLSKLLDKVDAEA